jgi:general secretion pathway protein L
LSTAAESIFAPIRQAAERAGLAEFLGWWKSELFAALPPAWRARFAGGGPALVSPEGGDWIAWTRSGSALVEAGRARIASLDAAGRRAAFRRLLGEGAGVAPNVWLLLPEATVLRRSVSLPLAAEEALLEAVGFELDRFTPLSAEKAWFDCRVLARDANALRIEVELAVAPRAGAEAILAELRELGATVLGVGFAEDVATASAPLNLLPPERRERPAPSPAALAARVLAGCTAALALFALVYPLWQKRERVITLLPRLDSAKVGADVAERLGREIERIAAEHNFIVGKKQGAHTAVAILEDLSKSLPDTTWVQQLDLRSTSKGREVQIAGETGSSSQLVEVIEKSSTLANASYKAPLTKGQTPNTERYLLAAEVKPRPLPDPLPEAGLQAPGPGSPAVPPPGPQAAPAGSGTPPATGAPANPAPPASVPGVGPKPNTPPAPATAVVTPPAKSASPAPAPAAVPGRAPAPPAEPASAGASAPGPAAPTVPASQAPLVRIPPGPMPNPPPPPGKIATPTTGGGS